MKPSTKRTLKKVFLNISAALLTITYVGNLIAAENAGQINAFLGTSTSKTVKIDDTLEEDYPRYFESTFQSTVHGYQSCIKASARLQPQSRRHRRTHMRHFESRLPLPLNGLDNLRRRQLTSRLLVRHGSSLRRLHRGAARSEEHTSELQSR